MNDKKCDLHDKELLEIRTEFDSFKNETERLFNEILEKLKPQFTYPQITGFLLTLVIAMAGAMIYITDVKSDTRNNTTELNNLKLNIDKTLIRIEKKLDASN